MKIAELSDLERCIELGRRFYDEGGFAESLGPFDADYNLKYLASIIESSNAVLFLHKHGMAGAVINPSPIAPVLIGQEVFWYVEQEHRGGMAALRMFAALEQWAKEKGAAAMYMICMDNMGDTAQRMYKRCGYVPREHVFVKAL